MTECEFCEEEFEDKTELHLHWKEEHKDELNSHQEEKVKKAERSMKDQQEAKKSRRRSLMFKGLTAFSILVFSALVLPQLMGSVKSSPFQLERQPMLGNESAPVAVVKFGDYQCGHCKTWDRKVKPRLQEDYVNSGKVKFYYVNFPVIGQNSKIAARAGEYVLENDPENFWEFHDTMYGLSTRLTKTMIISTAKETTDLTEEEIREGIDSKSARDELKADEKIAAGNGVRATPRIFVEGERIGNDYQSLKEAIEKNLPDEE